MISAQDTQDDPQITTGLTFGEAMDLLQDGKRLQRKAWNGPGQWVTMVTSWNGTIGDLPPDSSMGQFLAIKTVNNAVVPWLPSQSDLFARDWQVVQQ